MINRHYIISYLRVSYLLQLVSLFEIALICGFLNISWIDNWITQQSVFIQCITLLSLLIIPVWPQLDAWSRFQNYKQVKDHLYENGFQQRLLKPFAKSSCQRAAVTAAAEELGMGRECKAYFYSLGYRWYHFFPDFVFSQPKHLLTRSFFLNTFFVKYYKPRFYYGALVSKKQWAGLFRISNPPTK